MKCVSIALGILLSAVAPAADAVLFEVRATLTLNLGNGTPPLPLLSTEDYLGTGVGQAEISATPGPPAASLPLGIRMTAPEPVIGAGPLVLLYDDRVPVLGTSRDFILHTPQIGPGVLQALTGNGTAQLPLRGPAFWGILSFIIAHGPLTVNAGATGVGVGGPPLVHTQMATSVGVARISIQGAPWTLGKASLVSETANGAPQLWSRTGFAHGPLSFTSSALQTGGLVGLVTPIQIQSDIGGPFVNTPLYTFGVFGELTLHFVPEPSTGLLLAVGAIAVAALGGRRR